MILSHIDHGIIHLKVLLLHYFAESREGQDLSTSYTLPLRAKKSAR